MTLSLHFLSQPNLSPTTLFDLQVVVAVVEAAVAIHGGRGRGGGLSGGRTGGSGGGGRRGPLRIPSSTLPCCWRWLADVKSKTYRKSHSGKCLRCTSSQGICFVQQ
ncbi:hypothetical protein L1987_54615 [Smallanthus sonchifolius]|uniref:Uncharacterized protein n=1 Tax=Smallanthus sonchifolius TaxID=185202 RepID=A0ACB9E787_9ASTR|nr:hypothetical protein L1987_54615 [Smallanthus sonchifolius]